MKGPLFKYFGSKWRLSKRYPVPKYDTVIEPFAGSACYACRYADRRVILVEKNPRIAALWQWLIDTPGDVIAALPAGIPPGTDLPSLGLSGGALDLVIRWQRTGAIGWQTYASNWGAHPGQWTERCRDRIARDVEEIRHWRVICGDYTEAPEVQATWFIDPPYVALGDPYYAGRPDYAALSVWCRSRPGQTIVCEQTGADWLPFEHLHTGAGMRRTADRAAVWVGEQ